MLTFAMGDIHGMIDPLLRATAWIESHTEDKTVILLGDYVDRGPASSRVIDLIREKADWIKLMGNHDHFMVDSVRKGYYVWNQGGVETAQSYGYNVSEGKFIDQDSKEKMINDAMWMSNLPTLHEDDHRFFVHAGLLPAQGRDTNMFDRMWVRDEFLQSNHDFGKLVVHGHTPCAEPEARQNRFGIDTGCVFGKSYSERYRFLTVACWDGPTLKQVRLFDFENPANDHYWKKLRLIRDNLDNPSANFDAFPTWLR